MPLNLSPLGREPRLLIEIPLQPLQGSRFQPTGFPDLGAATFECAGVDMLLVESAQSMANRLEAVCWDANADQSRGGFVDTLAKLPYVRAVLLDGRVVSSITESHRLNSPFFQASLFQKDLCSAVKFEKGKTWRMSDLATFLFRHDPNSLIHGVFFSSVQDGRIRLPRALSAFIEADISGRQSGRVESGFSRREDSDPTGEVGARVLDAVPDSLFKELGYEKAGAYRNKLKENVKNIIGSKTEFAGQITAFFNLDLAQLRGYGLPPEAETLLIALSLYKIQKFLHEGLRLRSACDLRVTDEGIRVTKPQGFAIPSLSELEEELPELITRASKHFAKPVVTEIHHTKA